MEVKFSLVYLKGCCGQVWRQYTKIWKVMKKVKVCWQQRESRHDPKMQTESSSLYTLLRIAVQHFSIINKINAMIKSVTCKSSNIFTKNEHIYFFLIILWWRSAFYIITRYRKDISEMNWPVDFNVNHRALMQNVMVSKHPAWNFQVAKSEIKLLKILCHNSTTVGNWPTCLITNVLHLYCP
jgi:hypothetical protein